LIHHVALEVREADVEPCVRFWALLGFDEVAPPPTLRDTSRWVERGAQQIHLMVTEEPVAPPSGHVAVVAEEYDATLARLRDAGFEPDPRREHWGSPRSFVRSPAGHRVELMAFPPSSS
jgi:catechol 2,3-dioxygenase-like lactoylglutathione lyase family enzyme